MNVSVSLPSVHAWLDDCRARSRMSVQRTPLDRLSGWETDPDTGNIRHRSGKFFTIEGLEVLDPDGPVTHWTQPIINQPEVGVLGILVKQFDGVPHYLMQAKVEPGNHNRHQLSPTVQATRSNYTRVHGGKPVPYISYFQDLSRYPVIADVRQSEQGTWFLQKRNRNMIIEVTGEVAVLDGFRWLSLDQLHRLLSDDDLINMDARTVLSCLPFGPQVDGPLSPAGDDFRSTLIRSCRPSSSLHGDQEILSWITQHRTQSNLRLRSVPIGSLTDWHRSADRIHHSRNSFFDIIGVTVTAESREVTQWAQPMLEPRPGGLAAFLVKPIAGVLHALVGISTEPGYADVAELGPTVQCTPSNYLHLPASARPRFLDTVLNAAPHQIRFSAMLSEEGGRFYHARTKYQIIETDLDITPGEHYRWMTVQQLSSLLRHSHYLNIQARSLITCLRSLLAAPAG